jgi:Protein of unknown function (DUF3142)
MKPLLKTHSIVFALATCLACTAAAMALRNACVSKSPSQLRANEATDALAEMPRVFLWAWERPEDLRFLKAQDIGVAFLAGTIEIAWQPPGSEKSGVKLRPRRQPLHVLDTTPLMAVVRIETSRDSWHQRGNYGANVSATNSTERLYTDEQRDEVLQMILALARLGTSRVQALQIDFDASESEQPFYADLLAEVRERMPGTTPLSITALASWCIGDPWLDRLAPGTIDEAVPMLFRMGHGSGDVISYVESGREFKSSPCYESVGLSTDENFSEAAQKSRIRARFLELDRKRVYVFSPQPWTEDEMKAITRRLKR